MKKVKITYWISTGLISLMMLNSAYMCFASPFMKDSLTHLGFPDYFRIELGIAKTLGTIALLIPLLPVKIKEFAYAGFFIMFFSGIMAHIIKGDPASMWGAGIAAFCVLITSYLSYQRLQKIPADTLIHA